PVQLGVRLRGGLRVRLGRLRLIRGSARGLGGGLSLLGLRSRLDRLSFLGLLRVLSVVGLLRGFGVLRGLLHAPLATPATPPAAPPTTPAARLGGLLLVGDRL